MDVRLGDVVADGYRELDGWTVHSAYDRRSGTGCVMGMAVAGVVGRKRLKKMVTADGGLPLEVVGCILGADAMKYAARIADVNNACSSYEHAMLELKKRGYADIEVGVRERTEERVAKRPEPKVGAGAP